MAKRRLEVKSHPLNHGTTPMVPEYLGYKKSGWVMSGAPKASFIKLVIFPLSHHTATAHTNLWDIWVSPYDDIYVKRDKTTVSKCSYRTKCKVSFLQLSLLLSRLISWIPIACQEANTTYSLASIFLALKYFREILAFYWHTTLDRGYFGEGQWEWRNHHILCLFDAWIFYNRNAPITQGMQTL